MSSLVITEKPSVANAIADVLGAKTRKDGYIVCGEYLISWCVGHLVELKKPEDYDASLKRWTYEALPIIPDSFGFSIKEETKKQYKIVKALMHDKEVTEIICATDAGREGELIFRLVYEMAGCRKSVKRLWISSMEEEAIKDGFCNLKDASEYDNLYAGALARAKADWLVGMNGTRLFTVLYRGKVLKVGRVQTPTLAMLVQREEAIRSFQKEPFYTVEIDLGGIKAVSERFDKKEDAMALAERVKGKSAVVSDVTCEKKVTHPPKLYDLTTLQRDANRIFSFTAKQTLDLTQSLYEKKLVTYPRTDAVYLTDDMGDTAKMMIKMVTDVMPELGIEDCSEGNVAKILNTKKVTDHHAIIPTAQIKKMGDLSENEKRILYLIASRLLAATSGDYIAIKKAATIQIGEASFKANATAVDCEGFMTAEKKLKRLFSVKEEKEDEKDLCGTASDFSLKGGDSVRVNGASVKEGETTPPSRYTEDGLLKAMERAGQKETDDDAERKGLGTPATRADIIEKLVTDGFVRRDRKRLIPTDDGMKLITILPDEVKTPLLTAEWENKLSRVAKGLYSAEEFMDGIQQMVTGLVKQYDGIREEDVSFFSDAPAIGKCPKCGGDILYGKFGAYCKDKCGMKVSSVLGKKLTQKEAESIIAGKKTYIRGLKSKKGSYYDAYLIPKKIEPFSYKDKAGKEVSGYQYSFDMEFKDKK